MTVIELFRKQRHPTNCTKCHKYHEQPKKKKLELISTTCIDRWLPFKLLLNIQIFACFTIIPLLSSFVHSLLYLSIYYTTSCIKCINENVYLQLLNICCVILQTLHQTRQQTEIQRLCITCSNIRKQVYVFNMHPLGIELELLTSHI